MREIALNIADTNFYGLFESTVKKSEVTEINSSFGSAILVDKQTWDSLNETLLLLNDKIALNALLSGHQARDKQESIGKTIEEIFEI